MRRSFGCLSIPAIFSALITLLVIAGIVFAKGGSLFSAGALNAELGEGTLGGVASHAEIGGDCKACHTAPWEAATMADRCVVCHTEISAELNSSSGLHGIFLQTQPSFLGFQIPVTAQINLANAQGTPLKCLACHPEHRGAHAALVEMDLTDFPHDDLNFSLRSHQQKIDGSRFDCADCHAGEYANPFDVKSCVNCHFSMQADFTQAHALEFGMDCLNCHDGLETLGANFDHSLVPFQLTGHHTQAVCADCHVVVRSLTELKSAPQDCYSCHQADDNHQGLFGTNCAVCHTPEDWKPAKIDHDLSRFPLEGKHVEVDCELCHVNQVFAGTPQSCISCHRQEDQHNGQLGENCAACHSAAGWDQVHVDHSLFAFPLTGAHANVTCETCHQNGTYKGTPQDCNSCHQKDEPHAGRLGTDCATCHSTDAWKPAKFDHNLSVFKLTGSHVNVTCAKCHQNEVFKGTPQDCYSCHRTVDKHNGQFGTNCATCHSTTAWKPARFDHNLSVFKLTGSHVNLTCTNCHQNGVFKGTPQDCYSCHRSDDKHNGQFGTNCATCHSTSTWKGVTFDHNLAAFKLTGSHVNVTCTKCHQNGVFKGTPQDCYSCHRTADKHNGQFGTNCASCHTTSTWKGATFDHNLSAFKLTGSHVNLTCTKCHQNGVFKGTPQDCYSCHRTADKHNGQFGTNCASCHSTSTWRGATFDHNLSAFKLTGSHVNVSCTNCHQNGVFKGTPQDCYSCHRTADKHNGQFGTNCASCHSTSTWRGATFDHNLSAFKLTGSHVNVSCTNCHQNGVFKGTPQDCYSCHRSDDEHNGQFGTNCASCHTTSTWKGATFNHNLSSFPLTGRHINVACERCHTGGKFSGTSSACASCHADPSFHSGMFGTNCASCHSTSNWSATYRGSHPGIADEGGSGVNHGHTSCRTCHTSTLHDATCTACHDGNGGDGGDGGGDD